VLFAALAIPMTLSFGALAQPAEAPITPPPETRPAPTRIESALAAGLVGRSVEAVEVRGNREVASSIVLNAVRTRVGEPLDPATVQEDYQRIYSLRKFSNVQATIEPTETGVIVVFVVSEQRTITAVTFRGNARMSELMLRDAIDIRAGEAVDNFRLALARRSIQALYRGRNLPFADVTIDAETLADQGELIFIITEGPSVRVRNIDFIGASSFDEDALKKQIRTRIWIWIARRGNLDEEILEDDVASLREFYRGKGFFDVRVGRRIVFSADQTQAQVEFIIDEGPRYTVETITFRGNTSIDEQELKESIKLTEGMPFDRAAVDRDIRRLVDAYAPTGMIYDPTINDPDFLRISATQRFRLEPGTLELIYEITEGKPTVVNSIEVRGNSRTQQKVILRDLRLVPGHLYNATTVRRGLERLEATRLFDRIRVTPVGETPGQRDVLVEVEEARTALLTFGAGINSNGGVAGNVTYTQRNFDIGRWPESWSDIRNENALVGAGQQFRISLEPGTEASNASIRWFEPWLFDQPYELTTEAYLRDRVRENHTETYLGARGLLGRRFAEFYYLGLGGKYENVNIREIEDRAQRAPEILNEEGHTDVSSLTLRAQRDTTNPGMLKYEGTRATLQWETFLPFMGIDAFQKFTGSFDYYLTVYQDLLDRRTVLNLSFTGGYITGDSVFWERFYGGGIGSVRGFAFRGISPRSGPGNDVIGGEFLMAGTAELSTPIYRDLFRGVMFVDVGTVESSVTAGTIRSAIGLGVRITLPIFGQVPIAVDYSYPLTSDDADDEQRISFSLGFTP
jgi:outer membrane protein insertion porin family